VRRTENLKITLSTNGIVKKKSQILANISEAEMLKLDDGYELAVRSVDIDGNKVYLELFKDGQVVYSKVIIATNEMNGTFVYSKPGTPQKILLHVKNVFRGADRNVITLDHVLQTAEIDSSRILIDDSSSRILASGTPLKLEEGYEIAIDSVDIDGNKVYLELLKDGQAVDSQVIIAANEVDDTFVYSKPGTSQNIMLHFKNAFRGADQTLTTIDNILQTSEVYPYRVLINDSSYITITSGTPLKLEDGYELAIQSVDIDGNKVYVELFKDGYLVDSKVIITANEMDDTLIYLKPETAREIVVHFKNAFRGANRNLATIESILQ
jgi:hypothetical protein